eukprot:scaffold93124_cov39-Prasinocladus_malaysianus.AAC.1
MGPTVNVDQPWIALIVRSPGQRENNCTFDMKVDLTIRAPSNKICGQTSHINDKSLNTSLVVGHLVILQVRNAEQAGAVAAIVYDDIFEQLLIMSKPVTSDDPRIPSVFIAKKDGLILKEMMSRDSVVIIIPVAHPLLNMP